MKTYELKKISLASVFKLFGGMFLIVGLIIGLFFSSMGAGFLPKDSPLQALAAKGIVAGLIMGIIYGLIGGLVYLICAAIYNLFAAILGGIRIRLEEYPE
jgi:predicted membrane-bound spermidine synthase